MKWLFTDFDGTLRNNPHNKELIANEELDFAKKWQEQGNKIIISTGRPYEHISDHINSNYDFKPDYYLTNAGAAIFNNKGEQMYEKFFTDDFVKTFIKIVEENYDLFESLVYSIPKEERFFFHKNWKPEYEKAFMMTPSNNPLSYIENKKLICFKMSLTKEAWIKIAKIMEEQRLEYSFVSNNIEVITFNEIHPKGVSKGTAIKAFAEKMNIDPKDIIVAGDDLNDLSMFEHFFENSYVIRQNYNEKILSKAKYILNRLYEIQDY